jgi:hypothetical protein
MSNIINFPIAPRLQKIAENLWLMRLDDTPEARAQAGRIVNELRASNYEVPNHMKGDDNATQ